MQERAGSTIGTTYASTTLTEIFSGFVTVETPGGGDAVPEAPMQHLLLWYMK